MEITHSQFIWVHSQSSTYPELRKEHWEENLEAEDIMADPMVVALQVDGPSQVFI